MRSKLLTNFRTRQMDGDETQKPETGTQRTEALEDVSLALREHVLWPIEDGVLELTERGHDAVANSPRRPRRLFLVGGAVALIAAATIAALSLGGSSEPKPVSRTAVAVSPAPKVEPAAQKKPAQAKPQPTLQGAAPVFKADRQQQSDPAEPEATDASESSGAAVGNPATDTISSSPTAPAARASAATATEPVDGPPAGPAAVAVARKFAGAFVVYETGGGKSEVRRAFRATATPGLTKALIQRPPRQPAGVEVPKAKVLNVVPAPSHDAIYPVSVSLLRVGVTSELRLEMEQLKNKDWRVVNVLG